MCQGIHGFFRNTGPCRNLPWPGPRAPLCLSFPLRGPAQSPGLQRGAEQTARAARTETLREGPGSHPWCHQFQAQQPPKAELPLVPSFPTSFNGVTGLVMPSSWRAMGRGALELPPPAAVPGCHPEAKNPKGRDRLCSLPDSNEWPREGSSLATALKAQVTPSKTARDVTRKPPGPGHAGQCSCHRGPGGQGHPQ